MHILAELEVQKIVLVSYMRNRDMEDAKGSYIHGHEVIGIHFSMGNAYIESNECRGKDDPVKLAETMRNLQNEV